MTLRTKKIVKLRSKKSLKDVRNFILNQEWPGIAVKQVNKTFGRGVYATEEIFKDDFICDYNGQFFVIDPYYNDFLKEMNVEEANARGR